MSHRATWSRKVVALLAALALVLPLLTVGAAGAQDGGGGKVLRVRMPFWPDTLDPQQTSYVEEIAVSALDYEGLTRLDESLATVPAAAESWDFNDDGTVLTFRLRDGLTYSDGSPLTAERFRYAIERACDPNTAATYAGILFEIVGCEAFFASLAAPAESATPGATPPAGGDEAAYEEARAALGVRAVDDRTLEIELTHPAPYFPTIASTWVFFPVKRELVEAGGDAWWQDPANRVGNGPFRVTRIEQEQLVAYEANENYWGGRPKLDGIEYVYVPESAVALEAYRAGELHVTQVDPSLIPEVEADPVLSGELLKFPTAVTIGLMFNLRQEPFTDQKVREAFAYGFDRETFCAEVRNGDCVPTLSWIPEGVPGHIEVGDYAFDPEKAREALAASSYGGPEGLPAVRYYYASNDPAETTRSEWLAGHYRDVLGVELELVPTDSGALAALTHEAETFPQMTLLGWGQDYPDPQNWLSIYWTCDSTIYGSIGGYCNEEFDALIERADTELDPEKRIALYEEAGRLLVQDAPMVFGFNLATVNVIKPEVTGYAATSSDYFYPGQWASLLTLDLGAAEAGTPPS